MPHPAPAPLAVDRSVAVDQRRVVSPRLALVVGALTGLLGLVGMVRLVAGAFSGGMSRFAWVVVLAAMLPWVAYAAWRAAHGRLSRRGLALVGVLVVVGALAVRASVAGPVLALACSLAGFAVIWVSDWPARRPRGHDRMVGIEELQREED